jgi:hypothetical protein
LHSAGGDFELAHAFGWGLAGERKMRPTVVVLVLPAAKLGREFGHRANAGTPVELVFVGSMAPLDFAVALGAAHGNVAMGDPEISEVPGEIGSEFIPVVSLNALDGHREALTDLVDEGDGGGDRAAVGER